MTKKKLQIREVPLEDLVNDWKAKKNKKIEEANCIMKEIMTLSSHYKNKALEITAYYDPNNNWYFYELTNKPVEGYAVRELIEEKTGIKKIKKE